ncbi:DUF3570 domain-containing protein [Solimonas terrae]|uniref:DUF3570 domain-containing protein n=1 Tax=Solimonas terrae TaxID=1396819 RepID=A0A6M2BNB7_9GAMM|nr:DUF3570 domain-containing protein [Solimonas terrae]NGY03874.1 DUF3570 domain-containing protein [Solimonas terrae]
MNKTKALGAAACALLGAPAIATAADAKWDIDTAALYYAESGRVSLFEPVVSANRNWDERSLGAKLTLDTLTGPTPNGATPSSTPRTVTGPSGSTSYTTQPGKIPLDDTFKDTRVALALDYSAPLFDDWKAAYGLNVSTEYDYRSLGGSLRVQRDFFEHNTTLALGGSFAADTVDPVGGAPDPLSVKSNSGGDDDGHGGSSKSKSTFDLLAGVTQVLDPKSLLRVNLIYSHASGYLTDPYKILSVVGSDGEPLRYVYEKRPGTRTKTGVYAEYMRALGTDTLRASYRFQTDDWGIDSHTVELDYRWRFSAANYLEPQVRYYRQTAADFYHVALYDGQETQVQDASADYRLGGMDTWTGGLQFGHTFQGGSDLTLRLSYYVETPDGKGVPAAAADGLSKFGKLVPDTKAVMATVGYRFSL